jgi:hypothetical protein
MEYRRRFKRVRAKQNPGRSVEKADYREFVKFLRKQRQLLPPLWI